jgi:hypothetical protein
MFNKRKMIFFMMISMFVLTSGCSNKSGPETSQPENKAAANSSIHFQLKDAGNQAIKQINGIGYPGNDDALYIATNNGLKLYRGSKWLEASTSNHNYQSFQAVHGGFLASGHPEKGSGLKDSLGLVESVDRGKTLKRLSFYGQNYFHFLSGSFSGQGIFLINEHSSGNFAPGVYYSKDGGITWSKCKLNGLTADSLGMMAVHPKNGNEIAMATRTGIFYSEDYGKTMKPVTPPDMITALTFIGNDILFSAAEDQKIVVKKVNPITKEQTTIIIPFLDYDNPVTYIAANPKNENNLVFSTYKNDLFESTDGGKNWNSLIEKGKIEQE